MDRENSIGMDYKMVSDVLMLKQYQRKLILFNNAGLFQQIAIVILI